LKNFIKTIINGLLFYLKDKFYNKEEIDNKLEALDIKAEMQADWGENDPEAAGYIKNRTHSAEVIYDIQWDGDTEGRDSFTEPSTNTLFYHISDLILTTEDLLEGLFSITLNDGRVITDNIIINSMIAEHTNCICIGQTLVLIFNDTEATFAGNTFSVPTTGIYCTSAATELHILKEIVNKLHKKYWPDGASVGGFGSGIYAEVFNLGGEISNIASGTASHAEGYSTHATGGYSHAEGNNTTASGKNSHAEGGVSNASGNYSHAEGRQATASGSGSHAEGYYTTASGDNSHAEGYYTQAKGASSHTEGYGTQALNGDSHAEGNMTVASGYRSHAEGYLTKAASTDQHVQGKANIEDSAGKYAHIVGNGTSDTDRSNAHTLDWDGNAWFAGDVYVGGDGQDDGAIVLTDAAQLITVEDIDAICGADIQAMSEVSY